MKKIYKTIITFALSTLTPTVVWIVFFPFIFLIMVSLNPTALGPQNLNLVTKMVRSIFVVVMIYFWLGFFFGIFVLILSSIHMLFLGIPTFLLANHLKIIRWYTVLPVSFFIGGTPYILFMWGTSVDVWIGVPMTMGLFGFSAGMAFWLLWRFWVVSEKDTTKNVSIVSHML